MKKSYLVLDGEPFETDDIDVVLEMFRRGLKIYKQVRFATLEELNNETR